MVKRYLDRFTVAKKTVLPNIAVHSPNDKASHLTWFYPSATPLSEGEVSQIFV